jgi:glycosyltransferase involved in cell wall biosynthesis
VRVIAHVESPSLDPIDYKTIETEHEGVPVTEIHHNLSRADDPARAEYDNPHVVEMMRHVLRAFNPDLVHALHAMKLSGAALKLCYDEGLPVILTLADYWFICPRHTLLRWNNELCQGPEHDLDCLRCSHETHGVAGGRMQKVPVSILRALSDAKLPKPLHSRFWRDIDAIRRRHAYLREIVERANCVISLSEFQKEMYVRNGYDEHKIRIIHHGVETDGLKPASRLPADPLELVFIGSLVYNKGAHVLVNALGRRPSAKVRLLIYGDDSGSNSYLESLKRLAASDERVRLMGTFPTSEMGRVLETAHALAVPALWYENEPLVVKAAQYIGLPVLASNIGTLATSIQSGVNGWLIPPGDVEAWTGAIESLNPAPFHPDSSIKSIDDNACELFGIYEDIYSRHRCSAQNT